MDYFRFAIISYLIYVQANAMSRGSKRIKTMYPTPVRAGHRTKSARLEKINAGDILKAIDRENLPLIKKEKRSHAVNAEISEQQKKYDKLAEVYYEHQRKNKELKKPLRESKNYTPTKYNVSNFEEEIRYLLRDSATDGTVIEKEIIIPGETKRITEEKIHIPKEMITVTMKKQRRTFKDLYRNLKRRTGKVTRERIIKSTTIGAINFKVNDKDVSDSDDDVLTRNDDMSINDELEYDLEDSNFGLRWTLNRKQGGNKQKVI